MVFADGKTRLGFLDSTLRWFEELRSANLERSAKFHQLTDVERADILRRAARMARWAQCSLAEVCRRIAARTGRAVETIRYTIRQYDKDHPEQAVFPHLLASVKEDDREVIYRCFLHGVSVPTLAAKYTRSRGSIYRMINEMRARMLLRRPIQYIYNPQFELPNADEVMLETPTGDAVTIDPTLATPQDNGVKVTCDFANAGIPKDAPQQPQPSVSIPVDLPPYLRYLYDAPLLTPQRERELFRRYNYLKYKADQLRRRINLNRVTTGLLKQIEAMLIQANGVKNEITRANLRLVVSIAKKHLGGPQELFELVSDGNISLMKAVEKFDYSRGFRFSTYASWAIMRNYARTIPQERFQLYRYEATQDEVLDIAAGLAKFDPNEVNLPELRESIDAVLAQLSPRERTILIDHYGLDKTQPAKTLDQLGKSLGISKERVRQIELEALRRLRTILHPQRQELMR